MFGNLVWVPSMERLLDGVDASEEIEAALAERARERARERESFEGLARRVAEFLRSGGGAAPMPNLLTRPELAKLLGCSERTIQRLELTGRITRCAGLARMVRFDRDAVLRRLAESVRAAS